MQNSDSKYCINLIQSLVNSPQVSQAYKDFEKNVIHKYIDRDSRRSFQNLLVPIGQILESCQQGLRNQQNQNQNYYQGGHQVSNRNDKINVQQRRIQIFDEISELEAELKKLKIRNSDNRQRMGRKSSSFQIEAQKSNNQQQQRQEIQTRIKKLSQQMQRLTL